MDSTQARIDRALRALDDLPAHARGGDPDAVRARALQIIDDLDVIAQEVGARWQEAVRLRGPLIAATPGLEDREREAQHEFFEQFAKLLAGHLDASGLGEFLGDRPIRARPPEGFKAAATACLERAHRASVGVRFTQ